MDRHQSTHDVHTKDHGHNQVDMQHDVQSAKLAWEAWKSNDPQKIDWALAEKERIEKTDPKAWRVAMNQIDAEESQQRAAKEQRSDAPCDDQPRRQRHDSRLSQEYLEQTAPPPRPIERPLQQPLDQPIDQPVNEPIVHPGYAPDSRFAPPPPNSPAYDAAYNQEPAKFYGLDLGVVKLGVTNHGSIDAGVNIGLARAEVQAGLENRVDGEFMPIGGPLHARAGAGIGVNRYGLHSEVGAGANFFNLVNGDADFGAHVGRNIGVDGDVRGKVWPVDAQGDAGASIGSDGVSAYTGGNTDISHVAGFRTGGRFDLNRRNSGVAAGVGANLGDETLDFGPSIDTYGNRTITPRLHVDTGNTEEAPFYPTGDRYIDEQE
ncbi:MAG: hypothetical protein JSS86_11640 [Cyanobacteria bacterium SZAS LIN-2]|nr:hypothetical protein [Cyanobacteria bacterium SZAS LIN-2]